MSAEEQTKFLQELTADLNSMNIVLPSFPDVVIHIRSALEDPSCSAERLADVVRNPDQGQQPSERAGHCALEKVRLNVDTLPAIREAFDQHTQSMRQSVSG